MVSAATLALGLAAIACTAELQPQVCSIKPVDRCVQVHDEYRELYADTCETHENCQPGFECLPAVADDGALSQCEGICALSEYNGRAHERLLLDGFAAVQFSLAIDESTAPSVVSWTTRPEFLFVSCALFTCPPQIYRSTDARTNEIYNPQCILQGKVFRPETASFRLEPFVDPSAPPKKSTEHPLPPSACDPAEIPERYEQPSEFLVGCWAYGDTDIIGATKLLEIDPAFVHPDLVPDFSTDCSGPTDPGKWCILKQKPRTLGTCHLGECRERCSNGPMPTPCASTIADGVEVPRACCPCFGDLGVCLDTPTDHECCGE